MLGWRGNKRKKDQGVRQTTRDHPHDVESKDNRHFPFTDKGLMRRVILRTQWLDYAWGRHCYSESKHRMKAIPAQQLVYVVIWIWDGWITDLTPSSPASFLSLVLLFLFPVCRQGHALGSDSRPKGWSGRAGPSRAWRRRGQGATGAVGRRGFRGLRGRRRQGVAPPVRHPCDHPQRHGHATLQLRQLRPRLHVISCRWKNYVN